MFTVIYADIDDFKKINDTHGHNAGDAMLCTFAERFRSFCSERDFAGRIGGDEFSVMITLPDKIKPCTENYEKYILSYYETVKRDIEAFGKTIGYNVTLSVGTSCEKISSAELFKLADKAVYYSKNNGKNQLTFQHKMQ